MSGANRPTLSVPQTPPAHASGVLVIDKPAGWTSHDVVAHLRRLTGERHVGHAGTLDPAATGVLVVCLGNATRLVEYLAELTKRYVALIRFGVETDTWDSEGQVVEEHDTTGLSLDGVSSLLMQFQGDIDQVPPMYSALKRDGTPLYTLARRGETVERSPRRVTIHSLAVRRWTSPDLELEVVCSKGTYIRSLAHDLGRAAGTGAYLASLRRTAVGQFTLERARTLEQLAEGECWRQSLIPLSEAVTHLPSLVLDATTESRIRQGRAVPLSAPADACGPLRALTPDGQLIAILVPDLQQGWWRPEKVFSS